MFDIEVHDNFIDDFEGTLARIESEEFYTREQSNKRILREKGTDANANEGWTGYRTLNVKDKYPEITAKIEKVTGKIVDRLAFYKIDGFEKFDLWENAVDKQRPHIDWYFYAGVIYMYGNTGTYYNGELFEFVPNRMIWFDAKNYHMPQLTDEDRCVMVFFLTNPE